MKFKLVKGYQGSHEIQLAMERNEVQGICLAYDLLSRGTLARTSQINVLLQAALAPDPRIKDVPMVLEAARSEDERKALELFFARAAIGRPFVAPPDVPADRLAALRQAFDATLRDPAFLDDAESSSLNVVPITGERDVRHHRAGLQDAAGDREAHACRRLAATAKTSDLLTDPAPSAIASAAEHATAPSRRCASPATASISPARCSR